PWPPPAAAASRPCCATRPPPCGNAQTAPTGPGVPTDRRGVRRRRLSEISSMSGGQPMAISVMLIVPDADAAIAWYKAALGATELWDLGGVAGHQIGRAPIFLHEVNPENPAEVDPRRAGVTSVRVEMFTDDPDGVIERA